MAGLTPADYTRRQAAYDLKKLQGNLSSPDSGAPVVTRFSHLPSAALFILRNFVIAPILAGVPSPRLGRKPANWTPADRHYEQLRIRMQPLFHELGMAA